MKDCVQSSSSKYRDESFSSKGVYNWGIYLSSVNTFYGISFFGEITSVFREVTSLFFDNDLEVRWFDYLLQF